MSFKIQLSDPHFPDLANLNFSDFLLPNLPLTNPVFNLSSDGLLIVTYDYTHDIEGANLTLSLNLSAFNSNLYWAVPPSTINSSGLTSTNNAPLTFYDQSTYEQQQIFAQIFKWAQIISYVVLTAGMLCDKVIGIELFGVWQTIFFSMGNIDKVQPLLYPILSLKTVNGINTFMSFQNTGLPERIRALELFGEFIGNCSYTVWLTPILLVLGQLSTLPEDLLRTTENLSKRLVRR